MLLSRLDEDCHPASGIAVVRSGFVVRFFAEDGELVLDFLSFATRFSGQIALGAKRNIYPYIYPYTISNSVSVSVP